MKQVYIDFKYGNNKQLVLSGKKILTSRNYNPTRLLKGEIGYFYLEGIKIFIKYYGELKHSQVKEKTLVDYYEGEAFKHTDKGEPTEKRTKDFIKGKGKKHIFKLKLE